MKPLYWGIIAVVVIIVIVLIVNANNRRRQAEANAQIAYAQQQVISGGGANQYAAIFGALLPYFQNTVSGSGFNNQPNQPRT